MGGRQTVLSEEGSVTGTAARRAASTKILAASLALSNKTALRAAEFEVRRWRGGRNRLSDRLRPLRTLGEHLSRNLSEIRELIGQARQQASSIKVGMSVDGDCVRAYRPEISSSNFNT
ncbi:hypothetical protein AAFF_G00120360 [Aldrovandia affinis]|uniref:Laminin domain-containing protein n=1 Tax=Aldrovandia affinis TaxID=143900 RepID=A0AAD7VXQ7_9TELE|nr:hypothetical protein AAFF_G00120360 [Aldrovandia affinis]